MLNAADPHRRARPPLTVNGVCRSSAVCLLDAGHACVPAQPPPYVHVFSHPHSQARAQMNPHGRRPLPKTGEIERNVVALRE